MTRARRFSEKYGSLGEAKTVLKAYAKGREEVVRTVRKSFTIILSPKPGLDKEGQKHAEELIKKYVKLSDFYVSKNGDLSIDDYKDYLQIQIKEGDEEVDPDTEPTIKRPVQFSNTLVEA